MDLLAQMATFVRVVEAGSLSAAARDLRLSTAAVSRQLGALEESLGGALLLRSTRKLTVTEAGRAYYERASRILRDVDEAQSAVRPRPDVSGLVVMSAPVSFGLTRVSPHLPSLLTRHPELRVDLRLEDRVIDLIAGWSRVVKKRTHTVTVALRNVLDRDLVAAAGRTGGGRAFDAGYTLRF